MEEDLRVAFAGSLQLILDLVDARHHALFVDSGRTGKPHAADHVLPTLIGTPPLMAITFGSVVCSRRTGRVGISLMKSSVVILNVMAVSALRRAFSVVRTLEASPRSATTVLPPRSTTTTEVA